MTRSGNNRPFKYGAKDRREFIVSDGEVAIQVQNDGSGNAIYIGRAKVGTSGSESKWQISFQTYDGNDALLTRTWPQNDEGNPSSEYEFIWDNRATYVYA